MSEHFINGIRKPIIIIVLLFIVGVTYYSVLSAEFTNWDDDVFILDNKVITNLSAQNIKYIFTTAINKHYNPLTTISRAIDYKFYGYEPWGHHLTNYILHLLNTLLVFWFIYLLTSNNILAIVTTLVFALHPSQTEAVAWLTGRSYLLMTTFYLGSLIAYIKYARSNIDFGALTLALILCAFALASSRLAVTLPLVIIAVDYILIRKFDNRSILDKSPFFLLAIIAGIIAIRVVQQDPGDLVGQSHTFLEGIGHASFGLVNYLYKLVIPFPMLSHYTYDSYPQIIGLGSWVYLASPFLALGILALFYIKFKEHRLMIGGMAFFLCSISIMLKFNFLDPYGEYVMADRYTYIPYIGLGLVLGSLIEELLRGRYRKLTTNLA
ncbi:MAG: hypothetical protein IH946_09780, partial [Bacteroidetes bacterium]|nr:hypothetical protein [Bacteroidota bacterium]